MRILLLAADLVNPGPGITALLDAASDSRSDTDPDGAIATVDGRLQPLLSTVRLGALLTAIGDDDFRDASVMRLLRRITLVEVEVPAATAADVDTWDDWTEHLRHPPATWQDARTSIADTVATIVARTGRTEEKTGASRTPAPGDVLAADVLSPIPVPHYTSSAMDGFAVSGPGPWTLLAATRPMPAANLHYTGGTLEPGQALPIPPVTDPRRDCRGALRERAGHR